ncbi:dihydroxyacetone kinase subunit DhaL [Thermomicrobium sp.]|jgi:dihydroxyacetone kinase-like protein|uniref:dihydroxyacetone kinase subunit DhaL n=1 Tax=Thermomicrobium sp. TaxID=1969469 RepID=UPI001AFE0327|nr:dihydroxyacetone kinase subunit DhaL [Thermomicrobium sp.]MBO9307084.1 dihydroxyacetone kinase subunit L [Thermomicrobium sp.]MBO9350546.1 dihydroxyacetone kinase subunit L [Thermomicrobium sp.]MBO9359484.1 dihydroxyacetone kinase subunit L [Thermomicrobium sp.]MBO9386489.1 dihydroxyacetone kinase subunit L [Thermomicrobium sp.]
MDLTTEQVLAWIQRIAELMRQNRDYLTQLDAAIGDADHGANMDRGFQVAVQKLGNEPPNDIGAIFRTVGMALLSSVGGAAGPLYGTFFLELGKQLAGRTTVSAQEWATALRTAVATVAARGQAQVGDKTMIDALAPAVEELERALAEGVSLAAAMQRAAAAAAEGMRATIPLQARRGRASYLGERSVGHQDPGATSSALLLTAAAEILATE